MKRISLHLLKWYSIWFMLFYVSLVITKLLNVEITEALQEETSVVCFVISILSYFILNYLINIVKIKNNEIVKKVSEKYNKIVELNNKYIFKEIANIKRTIIGCEYSHKSFDRATARSIILC